MKFKNVRMIEVDAWDSFVSNTYGKPYSFQQQDDCKPRGTHEFTVPCEPWGYDNDTVQEIVNGSEMGVSFKAWLERDPHKPLPDRDDAFGLGLWWERSFYPDISEIVDDLYKKGLLEEGDYCINIDW